MNHLDDFIVYTVLVPRQGTLESDLAPMIDGIHETARRTGSKVQRDGYEYSMTRMYVRPAMNEQIVGRAKVINGPWTPHQRSRNPHAPMPPPQAA